MPGERRRIAVVGGANVDIGGFPSGTLVPGDSNPGIVRISAGGVGRNIAENAARLGLNVELVTALGDDANGRMLLEDCRAKGIGIEESFIDAQAQTSVYLFVGDARGDMYCAVSDMDIQAGITPERLEAKLDMLNSRDAVVIDANLPEETIFYLTQNLQVPVFADSVSVAKAGKLRRSLSRLYALKVNRIEAELLTGMQIRDALDASEAARRLVDAGVKQVFLTMGALGAVCADANKCCFLPCASVRLVSATGAGDACAAALVWAHCQGLDLRQSGLAGMAASGIALGAIESVSPQMNSKNLKSGMADLAALM